MLVEILCTTDMVRIDGEMAKMADIKHSRLEPFIQDTRAGRGA